jgi:hypothetical protein
MRRDKLESAKYRNLAQRLAGEYSLSSTERGEVEQLLEGLILHLLHETDSLIPAFIVSDLDISIYEANYERAENGEWVEESPDGYEVNDYKVDFVRNPDNHELVISYKQLINKMKTREYEWDWQDLTVSEKEGIKNVVKEFIREHKWIDVDKTYIYDDNYCDAIVTEGASKIKLGVKCGGEYFTIFVLKARPSEQPLDEAVDWMAERQYKQRGV